MTDIDKNSKTQTAKTCINESDNSPNHATQPTTDTTKSKLSPEDYIVLTIMLIGMLGPITMFGAWKMYSIYFPPAFFAILFGIAVAAILYRFLGGVHDAHFAIGALKITGSAAVFLGVTVWANEQIHLQMDSCSNQLQTAKEVTVLQQVVSQNKDTISALTLGKAELNDQLDSAKRQIEDLKMQTRKLQTGEAIPNLVSNLDPEDKLSQDLRSIQIAEKGPWCRYAKSKALTVSVVDYLREGETASCKELYGKSVEITSNFTKDGRLLRTQRPITLHLNNWITRADDCSKTYKYQIQLSCKDAEKIFPKEIMECGEQNLVNWKIPAQFLPIIAVPLMKNE